jgi:2-polyprenyl-3-methyl-5-hydroxy-6-metoxy-1,4-benzoquinol methylase
MRLTALLILALSAFTAVESQTREEVEKRIAQLPPDQKIYERYRVWLTGQPVEVQRSTDRLQRYGDHLKAEGFTPSQIQAQFHVIQETGRQSEIERWNRILTAEVPTFNTSPNAFLVEIVKGRKPGTALDVGMGQGRNAIWLAQRGWDVTGFDPAERALALANQTAEQAGVHLKTEIKGSEDFDFGENRWDLILLSYVTARGLTERIERSLTPGGILVIEAFHRDATKGRSIGSGVVFDTGEIPRLFPGLRVVRYGEPLATSDFGQERVRMVRYCAEKPQ